MNLIKFQQEVYNNKKTRGFNTTDVGKEIVLLTEELGELAKAYKHSNQEEAPTIDNVVEMGNELGDIMILCLGLFQILKLDSEIIVAKIIENNKTRTHTGFIK